MGEQTSSHQSSDPVAAGRTERSTIVRDSHSSMNGGPDSTVIADIVDLLKDAKIGPPPPAGAQDVPAPSVNGFKTADELLAAVFTEPPWAVANLLPAGMNILAGRPKIGKSWFALQVAIAVASGGVVLGEQVERRKVLYIALEDSERRLQNRLKLQNCPANISATFITHWPALIENGLEHLKAATEVHGFSLIVVDTLARWASIRKADDENLVTKRLGELQRWAIDNGIAVLLVDHHRKPGASSVSDVIDDVMGATAKTGTADAALGLYRQRGQQGAELKITGRDVLERDLAVQFDPRLMCWQLLGDAAGVKANTLQAELLEALEDSFSGEASCTDLARFLARDKSNVRKELLELVARGRLFRTDAKKGREVAYRLPDKPLESIER